MSDVLVATGEVFHNVTDIDVPGHPPLAFKRSYSSTRQTTGPLGQRWAHNWQTTLRREEDTFFLQEGLAPELELKASECDGSTGPLLLFDAEQRRAEFTFADGRTMLFRPGTNAPQPWYLSRLTDSRGQSLSLHHEDDLLLEIVASSGARLEFGYRRRLLSSVRFHHRDAEQRFEYAHDAAGHLMQCTDPLGRTEHYAYDGEALLVHHRDEGGVSRYFCYDGARRCILNWYEDQLKVRRLDFAPDGSLVVLTDSYGYPETYRLDEGGRIVAMTDPLGRTTEWVYAPDGSLLARVLPDGKPLELATWDDSRRFLTSIDLRGFETTYTYDAAEHKTTISNSVGASLEVHTDAAGNVTSLDAPGQRHWQFLYDEKGALSRFVNPKGEWIERSEHDGLVKAWDAAGPLGTFQFDGLGNLLSDTDALGRRTTYEYAGQNLLTRMTRPDGSTVEWRYDNRGRITSVIDGARRETTYQYSAFGSVLRSRYADGTVVGTVVDPEENLREIVNANGESTRLVIDEAGRPTSITFFDGRRDLYEYDLRNQVVAFTDAAGGRFEFTYDGANNPEQITGPDGTIERLTYDGVERLVSIDRRLPDDPEAVVKQSSFEYDGNNYVVRESHDDSEIDYEYDLANNLTRIRDNHGRDIRYDVGRWGLVTTITDGSRSYGLSYSPAGELATLTLPNDLTQHFTYDLCSRLIRREVHSPDGEVLAWRSFVYDGADQLIEMDDWRLGRRRYTYDGRGRLTQVRDGGGRTIEAYAYDPEGNLVGAPGHRTWTYDPGNRLRQCDGVAYRYDDLGRLTGKTTADAEWRFTYDARNQLASATRDGALVARYDYNLVGQRTRKSLPDEEIEYRYHGNCLATAQSTVSGRWDFLSLPFTFIPIAQIHDERAYYWSWDQVGVPTELWDEDGRLVATVRANAFGQDRVVESSRSDLPVTPFHFLGQQIDPETGLNYSRFRYYDPETGRFTTQDPFGLAAGSNLYIYPRNPLNWVDPLGLAGMTLEIKCAPSNPPPFTPCEQAALQRKVELMNENLQNQGRKARCTKCRDNEQKDYFIKKCGGKVPKGWQVDHIQELQVGGADKCCANLMAIPQRPNGSCGSQIMHQIKDYGGVIVGSVIKAPGCKQAHKCKSDGTRRGTDTTSCEEPNPVC